jgi:tellurite methyltransferase
MIDSPLASPSQTLMSFADELVKFRHRPAIDVGCGFGRNAVALASRGISVVCVDKDLSRLRTLAERASEHIARSMQQNAATVGQIYPVCCDVCVAWPFPGSYFSAVIFVHFFRLHLVDAVASSLVPGGFLYIETLEITAVITLICPRLDRYTTYWRAVSTCPFTRSERPGHADMMLFS